MTATINDPNYEGTASGTLVIAKATATVDLSNLAQTYDGNPKPVTVTTTPTGLTVAVTYDGSSTVPTIAGSYAVVATVVDANYACSASGTLVITGLSHSIDLLEGWNLVSFNLRPADPDIKAVLESVAGKYSLVYGWNASSDSSNWLRFDPALGFGNTLTELHESMGFWIYMEVSATLTVLGTRPTITEISLYEGWNLIGWPSDASADLPAALSEIASNYDLVMAYHAIDTADPWKLFDLKATDYANDLMEMAPGWGYWIKMTAADSLPIDY